MLFYKNKIIKEYNDGKNLQFRLLPKSKIYSNKKIYKNRIIKLYENYISAEKIALEFGLSKNTILRWLEIWGVTRRNLSFAGCKINKDEYKNDIIFLYKEGISTAEIAEFYGVQKSTVNRWLQQWNIPRNNVYSYSISKAEKEIYKFVDSVYSGWEPNNRNIVKNFETGRYLELDMVHHELKLAIEYNGKYWHNNKLTKKRDEIKKSVCKKLGYRLIIISDKDWETDKKNIKEYLRQRISNERKRSKNNR